ncbi:hypothetical protein [Clostridium tagluense]|nr:hypothetical protein [Clostridium tagluense]
MLLKILFSHVEDSSMEYKKNNDVYEMKVSHIWFFDEGRKVFC